MRSITETQQEEDKRKRNVQIFCFGLLAILLFSTIGYAFFSNPNSGSSSPDTDTGLRQVGDRWVFGSNDKPISLVYSPEEAGNASIGTISGIENYVAEPLFIDSENEGVRSELAGVFQYYSSRMQEACYGHCSRDLPEKNCTDNIIVFKESEEFTVRQENKCLFIDGNLRTVDAYIYRLFGISNS